MKPRLRLRALIVCLCLLAGCAPIDAPDTISAYASFYPVWALSALVGEGVPGLTVSCLAQPQDGCLRSYSLSDWDAALLAGADLCILGGRGLESFEAAVSGGDMAVILAMDGLPLIGLDAPDAGEDGNGHFSGPSPWLFLSVSGARRIAAAIAAGLAALDPDCAHIYAHNLAALDGRLAGLEASMREEAEGLSLPRAVLLQEGLCYFAEDMGLEWTLVPREAGAEYAENDLDDFLARVAAAGCPLVLVEKQAPQGLVAALEGAGYAVCRVDILSTRTADDGGEGYFAAMRENAAALAAAARSLAP